MWILIVVLVISLAISIYINHNHSKTEEDLRRNLSHSRSELEDYKKNYKKKHLNPTSLDHECALLSKEKETLSSEVASYKTTRLSLQNEVYELKKEKNAIEFSIKELNHQISNMEAKIALLSEQRRERKEEYEDVLNLLKKRSFFVQSIRTLERTKEDLENAIDSLYEEKLQASQLSEEMIVALSDLKDKNEYYFKNKAKIEKFLLGLVSTPFASGKTDILTLVRNGMATEEKVTNLSLSASANVQGSDTRYLTTLSSCTCPDFQHRHRPCKHMLALANALGMSWLHGSFLQSEMDKKFASLKFEDERQRQIVEKQEKKFDEQKRYIEKEKRNIEREQQLLQDRKKALSEKEQRYPWLASRLAELEVSSYNIVIRDKLTNQKMTSLLRKQTKEIALLQNQLAVYEYLFPILEEFKEIEPKKAADIITHGAESEDFHYQWLSDDEYDVLTSAEKADHWVDRYFSSRSKSAWEAGIKYERYIGYLCEKESYSVKYNGAMMHKEDMGRDLIVSKGKHIYVIQCKRLVAEKEVHENHIFQLLGSVVHLKSQNKSKTVTGIFVTTSTLSTVARECADAIGIKVFENVRFERYPSIKCNIGKNGERIYHLPYDQQYDRVHIEVAKGECYVTSCQEAEAKGFRHAWKHFAE